MVRARRLPLLAPFALLVVALCGVTGCAGKADPGTSPPSGRVSVQPPIQLLSCPTTLPKPGAYSPGPASIMVPATPNGARACRYYGLNDGKPVHSLAQSATISDSMLPSLVSALNAAKPMPPGLLHCPMDDDSTDLVIFDYPNGHTLFVTIGITGCNMVSNGARTTHLTSEPTLGQLASVVGGWHGSRGAPPSH